MGRRGRLVRITNLKAECPYCGKVNTFKPREDTYGKMTQQVALVKKCPHYTSHYRKWAGGPTYARFFRR